MSSYRVAIVDDDEGVRHSSALVLERAGNKVESFTNGAEFLAADLHPNLGCILLDMHMPRVDGLAVLRTLRERLVAVPVVVLTGHGDVATAVEAMRLGAINFVEKPCSADELVKAVHGACEAQVLSAETRPINKNAHARVASLTERQRSVLRGILKGQPNKMIAWELGLSIRTVETYRAQVLTKLGVRGTADAVRTAVAAGMEAD